MIHHITRADVDKHSCKAVTEYWVVACPNNKEQGIVFGKRPEYCPMCGRRLEHAKGFWRKLEPLREAKPD